jgi:hypothetical protein
VSVNVTVPVTVVTSVTLRLALNMLPPETVPFKKLPFRPPWPLIGVSLYVPDHVEPV